jgi:hypothetical protein
MNRATCVNSYCNIFTTYGLKYSNYNSTIVVFFPVIAFILNVFTYIGARRVGARTDMKKELNRILVTLIITFVDVLLIAIPNFVNVLAYNGVIPQNAFLAYFYVFFGCNSVINLIVYIIFKQDFRDHVMSVSLGGLKVFLKVVKEKETTTLTHRVAVSVPTGNS